MLCNRGDNVDRARSLLAAGFVLLAALASVGRAQRPDAAAITGIVYDSVARRPLADASIQLVSSGTGTRISRGTTSDSSGRFTLTAIPPGEYIVGFVHAVLDSLGIEAPASRVSVRARQTTNVPLAVPSPNRLHETICGTRPKTDSTGVVLGHLYDADSRTGMAKARVTVRWLEWILAPKGLERSVALRSATTADNGWFAICDVPLATRVVIRATPALDSTSEIEIEVPASRVLRRDMYFSASTGVPVARLNGVVTRADSKSPLANANVSILGSGIETTTDGQGRFSLPLLHAGTQMLETRAVGFLPDRRAIDLFAGANRGPEVALSTIKSVLDTVRVTASRIYKDDANGFERRRKLGAGHYFSAEDVERIRPIDASSLLRRVPLVRMARGNDGKILMPGPIYDCTPTVFIDRIRLEDATARDIDEFVQPEAIEGMEVYTRASEVPPQFASLTSCGAIVIWTRVPPRKP